MTSKCNACGKAIQTLYYLTCVKCNKLYDIDCLGIGAQTFEQKTEKFKDCWLCPQCVCSKPKQGNSSTPVRTTTNTVGCSDPNVNKVRGTRGVAKPLVTSPSTQTSMEISDLMKEIKELRKEIIGVREQNSEISLLRKDVQDLKNELSFLNSSITTKFKVFQKQLEDRDIEIVNLKTTISGLQSSLNQQEQLSLRNDLEIQGVPEEKTENLTHILLTLSQKLNVDLQETDINNLTRAGPKPNSSSTRRAPRPIVAQFVRKAKKDELISATRTRRNLTTESILPNVPSTKIYLNERLTKANRLLFREARTTATHYGFRYCWIRNGSIFVRKMDNNGPEKSPAFLIRSTKDLEEFVGPTTFQQN